MERPNIKHIFDSHELSKKTLKEPSTECLL